MVSGASSGLGEHIAELLADNGVAVVCAARRMDLLENLAERIKARGGKALAVAMDVTDRASVKAGFDLAEKEFGTPDIIFSNAGATGRHGSETPDRSGRGGIPPGGGRDPLGGLHPPTWRRL